MKISELKKVVPFNGDVEVIPMVILENKFFDQPKCKDYRQAAIDTAIKLRLPLTNTYSNTNEIVKQLIDVRCPICNRAMESHGGGGNVDFYHVDFECVSCKTKGSLSFKVYGINFAFK